MISCIMLTLHIIPKGFNSIESITIHVSSEVVGIRIYLKKNLNDLEKEIYLKNIKEQLYIK